MVSLAAWTAASEGEQLGHGGLVLVRQSLVLEPGGSIDQQLGGFVLGDHVGDLGLDHLVRADLLAELGALGGIADGGFDSAATDADRARGAADPGIV